jgi:hypothetical protein
VILSEFLGKKTENILLKVEAEIKYQKIFSILGSLNAIVHKRTHKDIIVAMR